MTVVTRGLLSKSDLAGWEVMELFTGGVNQSDEFFHVLMFSSLLYALSNEDSLGVCRYYWYFARR